MSVRTEPRDLSQQLQQTLTIPSEVMINASQHNAQQMSTALATTAASSEGMNDQHLHQANDFNTSNENHPLERTVCINIRASLSDLCLRAQTATWSPPSAEATKAIFQQARLFITYVLLNNPHTSLHVSLVPDICFAVLPFCKHGLPSAVLVLLTLTRYAWACLRSLTTPARPAPPRPPPRPPLARLPAPRPPLARPNPSPFAQTAPNET